MRNSTQWMPQMLGALCKFKAGSAFPKRFQGQKAGDLPFIKVSDLKRPSNSFYVRESANWIENSTLTAIKASPVPPGTVVFAKIGEGLKAERFRITTRDTCIDNNMMGAIPTQVESRFLYYLLSFTGVAHLVEGSALPYLRQSDLEQIKVCLPTLYEQRAIAATLGALDDKIESNRELIRLTSLLLESYSVFWGAELPMVELSNLTHMLRNTVNPSKSEASRVYHYSLPAFDEKQIPEFVEPHVIKSNKIEVSRNSVLVSRLNPRIDRSWWVEVDPENRSLASTEFACLTATSDEDLARVWLAVRHPAFQDSLRHRTTGTSGSHQRVRPNDVITIEVPDFRGLSSENSERVLTLLRKIAQARKENEALSGLRDTLLPEVMSGRIRVVEARDVVRDVTDTELPEVGDV